MVESHPYLQSIRAYTPGATPDEVSQQYGLASVVKVSSNENPFGCSPLATAAAVEALQHAHRYNDGGMALRIRLAEHHRTKLENVTVHNGSDAIIHQAMRTFLRPGDVALSSHGTFISFGIAVQSLGHTVVQTPLAAGYRYDVQALAAAITPAVKVLYIANPNNPTGTYLTSDEISWLLGKVPSTTLVILDEAYHEYALHAAAGDYPDAIAGEENSIVSRHPNVVSLRTFSKAYGLASLRVGYAVGSAGIVQWLLKTKLPFDPNGIVCAAAIAALDDVHFVTNTIQSSAEGLALLHAALDESSVARSHSVANFAMADLGDAESASRFHADLLQRGFITRPLAGFGLPTCVRISTGTPEQNVLLANAIRSVAGK